MHAPNSQHSQRAQYDFIKESTLNHIRIPSMILGVFLIEPYLALWVAPANFSIGPFVSGQTQALEMLYTVSGP